MEPVRLKLKYQSKDHSSMCDGCSVTERAAGSFRGASALKTFEPYAKNVIKKMSCFKG